jgi:Na+/H+ antiporter NhaD/arsenite permease-like protein
VLLVVLLLLYPLYLLLLSRLVDISFLRSMIAQTVLFFAGMYPLLRFLHKKYPSAHRNHKALV